MLDKNILIGKEAEDYFLKIVKKYKPNATIIKATNEQDMFEHWDYSINGVKIDVKAEKCIHSNHKTIIELTNRQGEKGWLYGKASFIAFQSGETFILAKTNEIIKMIKNNIILERVNNVFNLNSLYHLISTKDQYGNVYDLVTVVKYQDLIELDSTKIIKK